MIFASGGGHWTQMLLLRPAIAEFDVFYVGVKAMYGDDVAPADFYHVRDVSRLQKWAIFATAGKLLWIIFKNRPKVIITTGSAPGLIALRIGKFFGARGVWIDSIANVEELSMSGRRAGAVADLWLTQWEHLARPAGPKYEGRIL